MFGNSRYIIIQERVAELQVSGSIDTPEGGLDALLQAAVCEVSYQKIKQFPNLAILEARLGDCAVHLKLYHIIVYHERCLTI